ncbi:hypothetical protein E3226_001740 [Legionella geestiana]|uniref:hypothetical protein n=1 Tax=Legionella geestiana TaxID=45065 RepID=UPI001091DC4C|nr:hypothetical protein [Legionella geestiana]QDQ39220.1 hypothetical protein E3226_001740 [Legionella geestiana]
MKKEALIALYPWTNIPQVLAFCEEFNDAQWQVLDRQGAGDFIKAHADTSMVIPGLFGGILGARQIIMNTYGEVPLEIFEQVVHNVMVEANKPQDGASPMVALEVLQWFGEDMNPFINRYVKSDDMMENIIQTLVSKDVRAALAGDAEAISRLPFIPTAFEPWKGQDVRVLVKNRTITLQTLCAIAEDLYKNKAPSVRVLPAWIGQNRTMEALACKFTDAQLAVLSDILEPVCKQNEVLLNTLLNRIVSEASGELPTLSSERFEAIVQQQQQLHLAAVPPVIDVASSSAFQHSFASSASSAPQPGRAGLDLFTPRVASSSSSSSNAAPDNPENECKIF